jgi:hypothetical protein
MAADKEKIDYSGKADSPERSSISAEQKENAGSGGGKLVDSDAIHSKSSGGLNVVFENPLADVPREQLMQNVEQFCQKFDLMDHIESFRKGALISQNPAGAQDLTELTDEDKVTILKEHTHKWDQPFMLYWLVSKFSMQSEVAKLFSDQNVFK